MTNEEWKICFMEATQRDLQEIMDTPYAGEEKGFSLPSVPPPTGKNAEGPQ